MKKFNLFNYGKFVFAAAACLAIASVLKLVVLSVPLILGTALIIYAIPAFYIAMNIGLRNQIALSVFSFITGIILLLIVRYDILNPVKIIFPSLIFILGVIFIFLHIENRSEKIFLYSGIPLAAAGILAALFYREIPLFYFAERITYLLTDYWYIVCAGVGLNLIFNRKEE